MKPNIQPSDSTGLSVLFQHPARISSSSPVLGSAIDLRANPLIACSVFIAAHAATSNEQLSAVESARKRLVLDYASYPVAEALLPRVTVAGDRVSLYVFALGSTTEPSPSQLAMANLQLDNLEQHETYQFTPDSIYPCSPACAEQPVPCSLCRQLTDAMSPTSSTYTSSSSQSFPSCVLPRRTLRLPFSQFLQAARDRLVDDITRSSASTDGTPTRQLVRYQGGILLSPVSLTDSDEWSTGWNHYSRSYVHCQLHIHITQNRILIQPVLHRTPYFPLSLSLPTNAGAPIILLPHGIPAYFLSIYSGHVGGLTGQFEDALVGLGCSNWKTPAPSLSGASTLGCSPTYIIAWLSVQNRQGEEKGLPVIWPISLAALQGTVHSRQRLTHMPDLPPQLLASPPAAPAQAPPIRFPLSSLNSPSGPRAPSILHGKQLIDSPTSSPPAGLMDIDAKMTQPTLSTSPFTDSLRAFRSLSVRRNEIPNVARDVGAFVAAVAQERERERERLKREREGSSSKVTSSPAKQETELLRTPSLTVKHEDARSPFFPSMSTLSPAARSIQLESMKTGPTNLLPAWSPTLGTSATEQPMLIDQTPLVGVIPFKSSTSVPDAPVTVDSSAAAAAHGPVGESSGSFDAYSGFPTSWNQPENEFMDIDTSLHDYDFDMDMNMAGSNDGETNSIAPDAGFDLFTDDDFSFFDAPQSTVRTSAPTLPSIPAVTVPVTSNDPQTSGPGPPPLPLHTIPAMSWTAQYAVEGLTPRSLPASTPGTIPPELMPSTPAQTPPHQSGPTTPAVALVDHAIHVRRSSVSSQGSQFDPVQFAPTHKATDGKYASGKFALPTPPPDEVEEIWPTVPGIASSSVSSAWKLAYGSVTDPRVRIVRRLVGLKRRRIGGDSSKRVSRASPAWEHEHEEWASNAAQNPEDQDTDPSDSDSEIHYEEPEADDLVAASPDRSHTPPMPYLPLGPTLIQTGFHHAYLLPLSSTLRPPGTVLDVATGPLSVPTPVSPAAALGAASERSKALEAVVQLLVREIVENPVWADAWQANLTTTHTSNETSAGVWPADIRYMRRIIGSVEGLRDTLELREAYEVAPSSHSSTLKELDPPMLSVGKSDAVMQVLPTALRFWEKLGLRPRGGGKDITAFVFFEGTDDARSDQICDWLQCLSGAYRAKNFGHHTPGRVAGYTMDGVVPIQFDTFKKTLASFVHGLHDLTESTVFYIVVPTHAVNLTSLLLRQIFSAIRKVKKTHTNAPILFHLISESTIAKNTDDPSMRHQGMEILADAVYDRMPVIAQRMSARTLTSDVLRLQALFQEPAFTLARPPARKVTFRLEAHPSTLDVADRFSILHVGYRLSSCGKWLLAACIDQQGEMHELKVWLVPSDGAETFVVSSIWGLALHVAARASVEWRIVIAKLGDMGEAEVDAWDSQLHPVNRGHPSSQVFLLIADPHRPWNFLVPDHTELRQDQRSPHRVNKSPASSVFHDASTSTFLMARSFHTLLETMPSVVPNVSYIPDTEEDTPPPTCIIRPLSSLTLINVPAGKDFPSISTLHLHLLHSTRSPSTTTAYSERTTLEDVARNYHALALLSKYRWKLKTSPVLPFHLAALEVMSTALASYESFTD